MYIQARVGWIANVRQAALHVVVYEIGDNASAIGARERIAVQIITGHLHCVAIGIADLAQIPACSVTVLRAVVAAVSDGFQSVECIIGLGHRLRAARAGEHLSFLAIRRLLLIDRSTGFVILYEAGLRPARVEEHVHDLRPPRTGLVCCREGHTRALPDRIEGRVGLVAQSVYTGGSPA